MLSSIFSAVSTTALPVDHTLQIFLLQVLLLLFMGRLGGELLQRIGQPAVMGQLLAGVILGPSIFGLIFPETFHTVFPDSAVQKKMMDGLAQLGVLMLLLLTGMETDLKLVKKFRKTVIFTSLGGIILPFICGWTLGEFLPASLIPDPERRFVTSLFLATALSISSIKIVAMVIMEVDFLRRTIGQVILASAILDDTIAWIIIAFISGLAENKTIDPTHIGLSFVNTLIFIGLSFTFGRRIVAFLIRVTNDYFVIELPVITLILVLMCAMALITDAIGVHTVLGAFVAGILVGDSPILSRHIEGQLRGLIVALFMPIFFTLTGLSIDLTVLKNINLIELAGIIILIATFGKMVGCYIGGLFGSLRHPERLALAIGMNARGSTEVIIGSLGLAMGVLSKDLFTLIVFMAISTTLITPPLLRWALQKIPPNDEETARLKKEEEEEKEFLPSVERMLVVVDTSEQGHTASLLAGLMSGSQKILPTVFEIKKNFDKTSKLPEEKHSEIVKRSSEKAEGLSEESDNTKAAPPKMTESKEDQDASESVLREAGKGYNFILIGVTNPFDETISKQNLSLTKIIAEFKSPTALLIAKERLLRITEPRPLSILVTTTGADYSRLGVEVALSLAKGSGGNVTGMHVIPPPEGFLLRHAAELEDAGKETLRDFKLLAERKEVSTRTILRRHSSADIAILNEIRRGKYDLVVAGVKARPSNKFFFGPNTTVMTERSGCSVLIVIS